MAKLEFIYRHTIIKSLLSYQGYYPLCIATSSQCQSRAATYALCIRATTANDRPTHPAYPAPLFIRHLPTGWQQSLILLLPSVRQLPLPEALLCFLSYTQRFKIPQHTFNTYFPLLLKKTVRRFYFPIFYDTLLSRRFALSA